MLTQTSISCQERGNQMTIDELGQAYLDNPPKEGICKLRRRDIQNDLARQYRNHNGVSAIPLFVWIQIFLWVWRIWRELRRG